MLSTALEEFIMRHEGLILNPYRDSVGKLTIGYGRNLDDVGISKEEAHYLMRNDISNCRKDLAQYPWFFKSPYTVQTALLDMCFNLGIGGLLKFKRMIKAIEEKNYTKAALEALDSKWAKQVGSRAKDVALMIRESV
jgi:lysozyme